MTVLYSPLFFLKLLKKKKKRQCKFTAGFTALETGLLCLSAAQWHVQQWQQLSAHCQSSLSRPGKLPCRATREGISVRLFTTWYFQLSS